MLQEAPVLPPLAEWRQWHLSMYSRERRSSGKAPEHSPRSVTQQGGSHQSFFDHVPARDGFWVGNDFPINLDAVARPECGIEFDQKAEDANPLP